MRMFDWSSDVCSSDLEGLNQVRSSLAAFPMSIELLREEYEQHLEGKKRLNEVVLGFIDPNAEEEALAAAAAAAEAVLNEAEDSDDDDAEAGDDEDATQVDTGPDPAEVARRMELLKTLHSKADRKSVA